MLDAYRDLIDELLGTPTEIRGLVESQGDATLPPQSARLIAEIRDRDRAVLDRAQTLTRTPNPYLTDLHVEPVNGDADLPTILAEMESARGDLVSLLINLSLKDWERAAMHETEGEITLADEIERHVDFDETQRQRLRESLAGT